MNRYILLTFMILEFILSFFCLIVVFSLEYTLKSPGFKNGISKVFPFILGLIILMIVISQKPYSKNKEIKNLIINITFSISATLMLIPLFDDHITNIIGEIILLLSNKTFELLSSHISLVRHLNNPFIKSLSTNDMGTYFLFGLNLFGLFNQLANLKNKFIKLISKRKFGY
jgi:hypothetical protein